LQKTGHTVLLIEADRSLRRLIALGLQHRGMHVIEASFPGDLPGHFTSPDILKAKIDEPGPLEMWLQEVFESQQPDVIVLDIDSEAGCDQTLLFTIQSQPSLSTVPIVVLAWDFLVPNGSLQNPPQKQITCLTKPFDARTLFATLEYIQNTSTETNLSPKQEALLAARSVTSAPSIWPLITAVGLLLTFIGLMTQITISALGLVILIVALLWWTTGTKTKTEAEPLAI
jgi:CheY-like chemotaxis protein